MYVFYMEIIEVVEALLYDSTSCQNQPVTTFPFFWFVVILSLRVDFLTSEFRLNYRIFMNSGRFTYFYKNCEHSTGQNDHYCCLSMIIVVFFISKSFIIAAEHSRRRNLVEKSSIAKMTSIQNLNKPKGSSTSFFDFLGAVIVDDLFGIQGV